MSKTLMYFGFEVDDGWFRLIDALSKKLERRITLLEKRDPSVQYKASQVKSKFGTLHFYMNYSDTNMENLIDQAEAQSAKICETCGKRGKLIEIRKWWFTLCPTCILRVRGAQYPGQDQLFLPV